MKYPKEEIKEKLEHTLKNLGDVVRQMEIEGYEISDFTSVFEDMDYNLKEFMYDVYDRGWSSSHGEC